jgi:hypothetical protein
LLEDAKIRPMGSFDEKKSTFKKICKCHFSYEKYEQKYKVRSSLTPTNFHVFLIYRYNVEVTY